MGEVLLDGVSLTCAELERVALGRDTVALSNEARAKMERTASVYGATEVLRSKWSWLQGEPPPADGADAARSFVVSHCAGIGPALTPEETRALLVARANALAAGFSGVRPLVVERLLELLARDVLPEVPSMGAVGAAGSIQLAHVARFALGYGGKGLRGEAPPPALHPTEKEALALINGSSYTTALAALAVARANRVLRAAEAACALSFEVIRADLTALSSEAADARGHDGIVRATARLRELLRGSQLVTTQRSPDSFSVRCAPAVLGAATEAIAYVEHTVQRELNAPSDNPLVFESGAIVEAGLFHAAPVALVMDHLKTALTQVASIAERRVFRLTYGRLSGLPSFLVPGSGVNSGLMLAQYTAASVVAEAKALCMPASVDSIPTVQHQEDHVSMGPIAARSALEVIDRVADVIAIELLCAGQGLDFRLTGPPPQEPAAATKQIWERVRSLVPKWDDDRFLHPDLVALGAAVRGGVFSG